MLSPIILIEFLFAKVPFQTNLLFIGLILGGLPAIAKKVKGQSFRVGYGIAFVLLFVIFEDHQIWRL